MTAPENRRLFVGGIPRYRKRDEIYHEMEKLVEGVCDVILYPSATDKTKNRGFAFVEFDHHSQAFQARRKLGNQRGALWGKPICVDWAAPEPEVDQALMATVKVLYVRNLMLSTSEDAIRLHFDRVHPGTVERVKKLKDFAFVHYSQRRFALDNMATLNGSVLEGAVLEVQLAKPTDKSAVPSTARHPPTAHFSSGRPIMGGGSSWAGTPYPDYAGNVNAFLYPGAARPAASPNTLSPANFLSPELVAAAESYLYYLNGAPSAPAAPADPGIAAQKQRVALLARHSQLEAEKLAVMEREAALKADWHLAFEPPTRRVEPRAPSGLVPFFPSGAPESRPESPLEAAAEGRRLEGGGGEGHHSQGSSPGLSSISSTGGGGGVPSFGGLSALLGTHLSAEDALEGLRLEEPKSPHTPLFNRVFASSSPIAERAASPGLIGAERNAKAAKCGSALDSGLGLDSSRFQPFHH